ncbi:MAG: TlpA family protein disulfide reductase [Acidobacteria bacterium]|nr:TlpA family protein disulfide reductase [Acidobacteriota bacterium]
MRFNITISFLLVLFFSIGVNAQNGFSGRWYATLQAPAGEMPFELTFKKIGKKYSGELWDGHHRVRLQDFKLEDNKLFFGIDDARIRFEVERQNGDLIGSWTRKGTSITKLSITAKSIKPQVTRPTNKQLKSFLGEWFCVEKDESGKETPVTLVIRTRKNKSIEGTGIDPTGDFGVMQGYFQNDKLVLSRFDGQSLSLVVAKLEGESLQAAVSTSPSSQFAIFGARKGVTLPDPTKVAKINPSLKFNFSDLEGKPINFPNDEFRGKVVIVNIMGTWCHNCHDETPFLVELYEKYHSKGLEIISLCFEAQETEEQDLKAIARYKKTRKIPYTMLYAGKLESGAPAKKITGVENFGGYPTNIFVARDGTISATHTGFWGPATGEKHIQIKKEFEETINNLIDNK